MAEIRAFRGIRYTSAAGPLGALCAPPYDVIGEEQRQRLAARNPRNIVHVILPQGESERYRLAAEKLEGWFRDGIVAQERNPALYLYRQTFSAPDGRSITRTGFLGLLRLEAEGGSVRHHERTLAKPLKDRLRLIRATRTQLSPIFVLYSDSQGRAARALEAAVARDRPGPRPLAGMITGRRATELTSTNAQEFNDDDGVRHWLLPITDEQAIAEVKAALAPEPILIADGHHRYRAALEYRDRTMRAFELDDPELPENFVLTCFVRAEDPGLVVLPTHRLVMQDGSRGARPAAKILASLGERFEIASFDLPGSVHTTTGPIGPPEATGAAPAGARSESEQPGQVVIGARFANDPRLHVLRLRDGGAPFKGRSLTAPLRGIDVTVLHSLVLEPEFGIDEEAVRKGGHLAYERDAARAAKLVENGEAKAAFFLRTIPLKDLFEITGHGLVLPQKSTYFTPKLGSGLVLNRLGV